MYVPNSIQTTQPLRYTIFFSKNEIKCNRTNHITCSLIKTILSLSLPPPPIWKKSRFIGCPLPPKFPPGRLPSSSQEQLTYLVGKRVGRPQNLDMSILKVVVEKAKGAPTCTTQQSVQKCAKMHSPKLQAEAAAATTTRSCCWLAGSAFRYSSFLDSDFEKKIFAGLRIRIRTGLYIFTIQSNLAFTYTYMHFFFETDSKLLSAKSVSRPSSKVKKLHFIFATILAVARLYSIQLYYYFSHHVLHRPIYSYILATNIHSASFLNSPQLVKKLQTFFYETLQKKNVLLA